MSRKKKHNLMPTPLIVVDEDPVLLDGFIDSANALQLTHVRGDLDDHNDTLDAEHADLNTPSGSIEIRLADFTHGGSSWQLTASHINGTSVSWSRSTDHAHHSFGVLTDLLEVDVVATSNASPPQTKTCKIWIKTRPKDGLPDRP